MLEQFLLMQPSPVGGVGVAGRAGRHKKRMVSHFSADSTHSLPGECVGVCVSPLTRWVNWAFGFLIFKCLYNALMYTF